MSLRYCFEEDHVKATLARSKPSDLAVIDSDGISKAVIQAAVSRSVMVYDYVNCGALEKGRSYYDKYKHLRLARYEGWSGEYWIDPTAKEWIDHCINLAVAAKDKGAIGIYLDNSDIYYMVRHIHKSYDRPLPDQTAVYRALRSIVCGINDLGLVVMPNGGDSFVRRFYTEHPTVIKTINQEGALFEDFKRQPKSERQYRTEYMDWARKKGMYVRGIEYCKKTRHIAECKAYYLAHGWKGLYISKHTDLRGD